MLVIGGPIEIDPANRERAVAAANAMMEATRKEAGCIAYTFSADLSEPGRFHIFEVWEGAEALREHFESAHMARFQQEAGEFGIRGMNVQRYEVSSVGPVR